VLPDHQGAVLVDAVQNGIRERRVVRREGGEYTQIPEIDEAVDGAGVVGVLPHDLAQAVDAVRFGDEIDVQRVDDDRVAIADLDIGELLREVDESSDDLAQVVDAVGKCVAAISGVGIVEGGVSAAAIEEAMRVAGGIVVRPDHLARGVDASCKGAVGGQGIVEGRVGKDWHGVALLVASACRHCHHLAMARWSDHPLRPGR
jgi:hypothetical protein